MASSSEAYNRWKARRKEERQAEKANDELFEIWNKLSEEEKRATPWEEWLEARRK